MKKLSCVLLACRAEEQQPRGKLRKLSQPEAMR
nr:MAG TPA: hypothetical protein [Caudoviricetes sp.]